MAHLDYHPRKHNSVRARSYFGSLYFRDKNRMAIQIGDVARSTAQNNAPKIPASISPTPARSRDSHIVTYSHRRGAARVYFYGFSKVRAALQPRKLRG